MRVPTGAMASKVSAPASAMMTVLDGMFCAPIAPRTICSTVEIFTNAVSVMNANGNSAASAKIMTSVIGRMNASPCTAGCAGAPSATLGSSSAVTHRLRLLAKRTAKHLPKCQLIRVLRGQVERALGDFTELGDAGLARADDVNGRAHAHQINGSPRV